MLRLGALPMGRAGRHPPSDLPLPSAFSSTCAAGEGVTGRERIGEHHRAANGAEGAQVAETAGRCARPWASAVAGASKLAPSLISRRTALFRHAQTGPRTRRRSLSCRRRCPRRCHHLHREGGRGIELVNNKHHAPAAAAAACGGDASAGSCEASVTAQQPSRR